MIFSGIGSPAFFKHRKIFLIVVLMVFSLPVIGEKLTPEVHAATTASMTLNPSSIANPSMTSGDVTFKVNLANAPSINEFYVSLFYNYSVLQGSSIAFSGNVLGSNAAVLAECIDGVQIASAPCQSWDQPGASSFGLVIFGSQTTAPTNGLLFQMTFKIAALGFSQLHFLHTILGNGTPNQVPVATTDGYFTNVDCPAGSGLLCKPTVPSITVSPSTLAVGQLATFNASASSTPNQGASIRTFTWDFGDGTSPMVNQLDPADPVFQHVYGFVGNYTVTLSVTDSDGVTASKAQVVRVLPVTDFEVSLPSALGTVIDGTDTTVSLNLTSLGGFSGLISLSVRVNPPTPSSIPPIATLAQTSLLLSPGGSNSTSILISTNGATTGLYGIEVVATSGSIQHTTGTLLRVDPRFFSVGLFPVSQTSPGQSVTMLVTVTSYGFNGTVALETATSPVGNGITLSLSSSSLTVTAGTTRFVTLTFTTSTSTPVGSYDTVVTGSSGNLVADEHSMISVSTPPASPPLLSQLHWRHRLSIARESGRPLFVVGAFNPNTATTIYGFVQALIIDQTGSQAQGSRSQSFTLAPGKELNNIDISQIFSATSTGLTFNFFLSIQWGISADRVVLTSGLSQDGVPVSGSFQIVP